MWTDHFLTCKTVGCAKPAQNIRRLFFCFQRYGFVLLSGGMLGDHVNKFIVLSPAQIRAQFRLVVGWLIISNGSKHR